MKTKSIWRIWVFAGTVTTMSALAQVNLGNVTGSVSGAVQGTANASSAISGPANPMPASRGLGQTLDGSVSLMHSAALSSQLTPLLPAATSLPAAAAGFESEGDFMAALHAAHNLNIPFDRLKAQTTGHKSMSLSRAIQKLQPDLDSKSVNDNVTLAHRQTERDVRQAASTQKRDPVAARITSNQALSAQITPLLPAGSTLAQAAAGFKNEEQFLSTLHAAHDHDLAFADLKDRVTAGQSLDAAMQGMTATRADASVSASANARVKTQ